MDEGGRLIRALKQALEQAGWQVVADPFSMRLMAQATDVAATKNGLPLRKQVRIDVTELN